MTSRNHLIFLYRKSRIAYGSTTMRAHQLSQCVAPHLPETNVRLQAFSRHELFQTLWARMVPHGSTIFATKGVVRILCAEAVHILHKRGCTVLADVVDLPNEELPGPELGVDCLISPSFSGVARLQAHVDAHWGGGGKASRFAPAP